MFLDEKIEQIRADFTYLDEEKTGKKIIYLDNAATSQKPIQVIDAVSNYYKYQNANPHRGAHYLSILATNLYENSRQSVADFINAKSANEIVFTRSTTESINLIAYTYGLDNIKKDDEIIVTLLDHHSNFVPWQFVAKKTGAKLRLVHITDNFELDMDEFNSYISDKTKLVAFTGCSNLTSYMPDVKYIIGKAKEVGATTVLDGAQTIPHKKVDVQDLDVDFFAFSGHKMLAPLGIGVLYGKEKLLNEMSPFNYGGDMIEYVYEQESTFAKAPTKFEGGTQNVGGVVGLCAAIEYMNNLGLENIFIREQELTKYAYENLKKLDFVDIYYPATNEHTGSAISFNVKQVHPHDVATILDESGIAIRSGHHCVMPAHIYLGINASCRASFAFYNTKEEIDEFLTHLEDVRRIFA